MTRTALQRPDAHASVVARAATDVSTITTRYADDQEIACRVGDVVVDLARPELGDVGAAVDLAQPDPHSS